MMAAMSPPPRALALLVPAAALLLAACSSSPDVPAAQSNVVASSSATPTVTVSFRYGSFEPSRVTIHTGETVQWQWQETPVPANVTFADFSSPTMESGTWSHTFSETGTYQYRDTLRQGADGTVVVVP